MKRLWLLLTLFLKRRRYAKKLVPVQNGPVKYDLEWWHSSPDLVTEFRKAVDQPIVANGMIVLHNMRPAGVAPNGWRDSDALIELGRRIGYDECLSNLAGLAIHPTKDEEPEPEYSDP